MLPVRRMPLSRFPMPRRIILVLLMLAVSAYDWPQFGFNSQHSGNNTLENTLNSSNAAAHSGDPGRWMRCASAAYGSSR